LSVNLKRLPDDEETVRRMGWADPFTPVDAIQNVLDALNFYRCRAMFAEQELARHPEPDAHNKGIDP
jgi:hypothetical protein